MNIPKLLLFSFSMFISGCTSNPGVVSIGPNTYMIMRSSSAGAFANMAALRAKVIQEANAFAVSKDMIAIPLSGTETRPTVGFPSFDYQFRLVGKNDPEAIMPGRGLVVERRDDSAASLATVIAINTQMQQQRQSSPSAALYPQPALGTTPSHFESKPFVNPDVSAPQLPQDNTLPTQYDLEKPLPTGNSKLSADGVMWYEYKSRNGTVIWSKENISLSQALRRK